MASANKSNPKSSVRTGKSLQTRMRSWIQARKKALKFIFLFLIFIALFYIVWPSSLFNDSLNPAIENMYAVLSSRLLNLFGQQTVATGDSVSSAFFSIKINRGCDAIEAMALFASALLAFPAAWKRKLSGLCAGLFFLFAMNLLRIVSLFLIGRYAPDSFEFFHVEVWQIVFILFALGAWLFWAKSQLNHSKHADQ